MNYTLDCRRRIEEKNRLLTAMGPAAFGASAAVDVGEVDGAWEAFSNSLQQHENHLELQKDHLVVQLTSQVLVCYVHIADQS